MEPNSTQAVKADPSVETKPVKRRKRGDTREDGKVFWAYDDSCLGGEYWADAKKFVSMTNRERSRAALRSAKHLERLGAGRGGAKHLRMGDTREDGLRFMVRGPSYADGEWWVTPEQFDAILEKKRLQRKYRRSTDPLFALKCRLRCRVSSIFKKKGIRRALRTEAMLGCAYAEFRTHIERLFLPGMSWANFSKCHIDHLVPLDAAKTEEDVYALNHFTNLRPMWGPDNLAKNATLPEENELPDNLHPKVREIWERAIREAK